MDYLQVWAGWRKTHKTEWNNPLWVLVGYLYHPRGEDQREESSLRIMKAVAVGQFVWGAVAFGRRTQPLPIRKKGNKKPLSFLLLWLLISVSIDKTQPDVSIQGNITDTVHRSQLSRMQSMGEKGRQWFRDQSLHNQQKTLEKPSCSSSEAFC